MRIHPSEPIAAGGQPILAGSGRQTSPSPEIPVPKVPIPNQPRSDKPARTPTQARIQATRDLPTGSVSHATRSRWQPPPASMTAFLIHTDSPRPNRVELTPGIHTVGRDPDTAVQIDHPSVSG